MLSQPTDYLEEGPSQILRKTMMRTLFAAATLLIASFTVAQAPLPPNFAAEIVLTGVDGPVDLAFVGDSMMFIAEKPGRIRVAVDGELLDEPFLDISYMVNDLGDRGLTGIAVHPRFPDVPYVYVSYTYDPPEVQQAETGPAGPDGPGTRVSRVSRIEADPASNYLVALPNSEYVLIGKNSTFEFMGDAATRSPDEPSCGFTNGYVQDCMPADEHSHTSGRLVFGPDGAFYIGSGDGADYVRPTRYHIRTLDLDSLAGKVLRVDPITGEGLADNPFFDGDPTSNRSKVVSYGLRNPYSFTFDPNTWDLVMGDVGWATWEMIKVGSGKNFGWPCYEGGNGDLLEQPTFREVEPYCTEVYGGSLGAITAPSFAYNREGTGGAITVGDIYTGTVLPEEYRGALFITDYYLGWIRVVRFGEDGAPGTMEPFAEVPFPVLVKEGPDQQLYYLNVWGGEVVKLAYLGENGSEPAPLPVVVATVTPQAGREPLMVRVDATPSFDPSGGPLSFELDFAGEFLAPFPDGSWLFLAGEHVVRITATNAAGTSTTAEYVVRVGATAPQAAIDAIAGDGTYRTGQILTFTGSGVSADGEAIGGENMRWELRIHYADHADPRGLAPATVGEAITFYAADRGEESLELCLTVVDAADLEATTCTTLTRHE